MAESQIHIDLVRLMSKYVQSVYNIDIGHIFIDLPETLIGSKPPVIRNFRPDLFVRNKHLLIIGEAKTEPDWDKRHSREQYQNYLEECLATNHPSILLLAVPWRFEKSIYSRISHMCTNNQLSKVKIVVISDMTRM
jgi:hypothetical protein